MQNNNPLVSIITCTKNGEKFLKLTLDSVKNQTYKNIEHIFIDGFSTDKTLDMIEEYRKNNPQIKTYLYQYPAKGIANALNLGYMHAKGEIIHYLHSDDYYYQTDSVEKAVDYFNKNPTYDWVTGNLVLRLNSSTKVHIIHISRLFRPKTRFKIATVVDIIHHENTFVKRRILDEFGPFEESNKITIEYPIWLRALKKNPPLPVDESFTVFIIHSGSSSTGNMLNFGRALAENAKSWKQAKSVPLVGDISDSRFYTTLKKIANKLGEEV